MPALFAGRFFYRTRGDESQRRHETDADYLSRMVRENKDRDNFSALTFRFTHNLGLDLSTAQLARIIAGYDYVTHSLYRYTELDLSAAGVYSKLSFPSISFLVRIRFFTVEEQKHPLPHYISANKNRILGSISTGADIMV